MAPEQQALRPRPVAGVAADTEHIDALRPRPVAGVVANTEHTDALRARPVAGVPANTEHTTTADDGKVLLRERLIAGVDRCVKCGLCLPHCPTYLATRNEADSPRGRLSLMAALAQNQLRADAVLTTHLDQCLHCLRCQRACPAEVAYAGLIDDAKELLRAEKALPAPPWWLRWLLDHALLRRAVAGLVNLWQRSGGAKLSVLSEYTAMLPQAAARKRTRQDGHGFAGGELAQAPAHARTRQNDEPGLANNELPQAAARKPSPQADVQDGGRGEVLLFTGCVAEITDQVTLNDAQQLLQAAGFAVRLPEGRTCCGALDQHAGDPRRAQRFREQNLKAFEGTTPIVSCASGCGAQWRGYGGDASRRHFDILDFLCGDGQQAPQDELPAQSPLSSSDSLHKAGQNAPQGELPAQGPLSSPDSLHENGQDALQGLAFAPLAAAQTVALHMPCTQIGASGRVSAAKALLARIPGLDLADLPDRTGCCGAAGLHLLRQSGMGGRLIADKIGALEAMNVKTLLTTNVGCAMHFRRALHAKGLAVSVMHPVSLLRRQLARAANTENNQ